jgi:hypothetical protein
VANDDEKVLSQADVDALVALVPDAPAPRAAAPSPPPQAAPPPPVSVPPVTVNVKTIPAAAEPVRVNTSASHGSSVSSVSLGEVMTLKKSVDDLTKQVNKFANTAQRLDALEERIGELAFNIERNSHNQPAVQEIAVIQRELRHLSQQLDHRPQGLKEEFFCEHCESAGTMAVMTKCTSCGKEGWFGWWPRKKTR